MRNMIDILRAFVQEEDGATLAEYLVLLGIITLAVIGGITLFGTALGNAFSSWATWIGERILQLFFCYVTDLLSRQKYQ